jgi:tight adherence protein B
MLDIIKDPRILAALTGLSWTIGFFSFFYLCWQLLKLDRSKLDLSDTLQKDRPVYASPMGIDISLYSIISGSILFIAVFIATINPIFAIIAGGAGLTLPHFYQVYQTDQERKKFERDLPQTVEQIARWLRSGRSLEESMRLTSRDAPSGTRREMRQIASELDLNVPVNHVMTTAAKRIGSDAFNNLVVSLAVARKRGGDIPVVLMKLSGALREIIRLNEKLRTATMDGKRTVLIIAVMPFVITLIVMMGQPQLIETLTGEILGIIIMLISVILYIGALYLLNGILKTKI